MEETEQQDLDPKFFDRADAHIHLSNSQLADINPGKVSASMMYATARFNAYVSWSGFNTTEEMSEQRESTLEYFTEQYRLMLDENLNDYIMNFEVYRGTPAGTHPDGE